ncbi:DUF6165 family protein [Pseudoroseomonas cervicalis]|uniref:DUF6165 family protein n=1 Tax=Teichococcus cervicalis TaxID=204525 RepID=UPI002788A7AB|nr:DUF6165 family protein [Pseudoroseomonas cervicalis]MDQ1079563.1 hypothetical protein [Pseudoroseomonas cervicalis]
MTQDILVPTSVGELIDKITILELKMRHIKDAAKLANVRVELQALQDTFAPILAKAPAEAPALVDRLREINGKLWVIEDDIRECERKKDFGETFISLARAVYFTNDDRAAVKRELNVMLGSRFVEEKSYAAY